MAKLYKCEMIRGSRTAIKAVIYHPPKGPVYTGPNFLYNGSFFIRLCTL